MRFWRDDVCDCLNQGLVGVAYNFRELGREDLGCEFTLVADDFRLHCSYWQRVVMRCTNAIGPEISILVSAGGVVAVPRKVQYSLAGLERPVSTGDQVCHDLCSVGMEECKFLHKRFFGSGGKACLRDHASPGYVPCVFPLDIWEEDVTHGRAGAVGTD